jgi:IS30 family transposase
MPVQTRRPISADEFKQFKSMRKSGKTLQAIATEFNRSPATILSTLRRHDPAYKPVYSKAAAGLSKNRHTPIMVQGPLGMALLGPAFRKAQMEKAAAILTSVLA